MPCPARFGPARFGFASTPWSTTRSALPCAASPTRTAAARPIRPAARPAPRLRAAAAVLALGLAALAGAPAAADTLTPAPAGAPANASPVPLAPYGAVEQEFFLAGTAATYSRVGTWAKDGRWAAARGAEQPYQTRLLVRRPADPARFNGTVVVEWFNVSSGFDIEVEAGYMLEELLEQGYAWVGVSAQRVGVNGLKEQQAARYAGLSISSDDLSYGIFTDAARAVREQAATLLPGMAVRRLIGAGQSQSSIRLVTYANAVQPLERAFDALIIHGRGPSGAPIASGSSGPSVAHIRTDQATPVLQIQTEFEMSNFLGRSARQPDSPTVRNWEIAGASHIDAHLIKLIDAVSARDLGFAAIDCVQPVNDFPLHRATKAALRAVNRWVTDGTPPPAATPMAYDALGFLRRDATGNVLGGVRLPEIDAPVANYGTSNIGDPTKGPGLLNTLACALAGNSQPLTAAQLRKLYASKADYVARIRSAAQRAVQAGFLVPGDDARSVQEAQARALPLP